MAYRPLHRTLGETSLEVKCLFFFGLALLLVISVSLLLYWQVTKEVVYQQNPNAGRLLVDQIMMVKHLEAFEEDEDYLTYFREDLSQKLGKQEYEWRFIPRPDASDEPAPALDQFEKELLVRFMKVPPDESADYEGRLVANGRYYQYYQPIRAQASCLSVCHAAMPGGPGFDPASSGIGLGVGEPLSEGDLMGLMQVTIPNGPTQAAINWYWNTMLAVSIITAFLALVAFYITIRYVIVRPVRHLREVSDAISRGNIAMRAEIRTGDEFETLAVAFNRMLRHLVTVQDELRRANVNLDGKVDELAQLNMQLYEMNRIKSDFLATMSHELKTPLNSILGFSDVLGSIDSLDEKQKRYVENIRKSGRMLLEMINNILDLAKIESGKIEIQLTDFSIEKVVNAQCDMARPLSEKKNIDLETEIEPRLPPMHQDQARVQQILNNLLSNAIKFTPEGGRVKVSVGRDSAERLVMRVIDTGVGIAEEDQQTIFEKFRQGRTAMPDGDAMTREYPGTGLGLSIVRELCKLLDGEVSVESELGTGSTFTVRLPWRLKKQPRHEFPSVPGLEDLAKPQLELARNRLAQPLSAGSSEQP